MIVSECYHTMAGSSETPYASAPPPRRQCGVPAIRVRTLLLQVPALVRDRLIEESNFHGVCITASETAAEEVLYVWTNTSRYNKMLPTDKTNTTTTRY
jgi:hypothetical protein